MQESGQDFVLIQHKRLGACSRGEPIGWGAGTISREAPARFRHSPVT